jgi:putative ABC transport system permease protein
LDTEPARPLVELLAGDGAVVHESLLGRLDLKVGDPVWIGAARFTITGVVRREPDRSAGALTLGPRVLIAAEALGRTGLVQFGSRVRHRALVRLPEALPARATRAALLRELPDPAVRVTAFDDAEPGLRRFFGQLTSYLSLVGLVSLLVGGLGVAASVRTFLEKKRLALAILKCLGAESRQLLATYLAQTLALAAVGGVLGAALGVAVERWVPPRRVRALRGRGAARAGPCSAASPRAPGHAPVRVVAHRTVRDPAASSSRLVPAGRPGAGRGSPPSWRPVASPRCALWQAGCPGIGASSSAPRWPWCCWSRRPASRLARRLPRLPSLAWRQGVAALHRPGSQATGVVVALGIGVMLMVAVALLERALDRQLDHDRRAETPSFFFVDIQPDQADDFVRTVRATGGAAAAPVLIPVVRSRLVAIKGEPIRRERWEVSHACA